MADETCLHNSFDSFTDAIANLGQDNLGQDKCDRNDICTDLYLLMIFGSVQIAIGGLQILGAIAGRVMNKGKVGVEESAVEVDGEEAETASSSSISILGLLSFISGVILICVYTSGDHDITIYRSFQAAIWMDVINFSIGILLIILLTIAFMWKFICSSGRLLTLRVFISSLLVTAIATCFYGAVTFIGLPYIKGDCKSLVDGTMDHTYQVKMIFNDFIFEDQFESSSKAESQDAYQIELQQIVCENIVNSNCSVSDVKKNVIFGNYTNGVSYTVSDSVLYDSGAADGAVQTIQGRFRDEKNYVGVKVFSFAKMQKHQVFGCKDSFGSEYVKNVDGSWQCKCDMVNGCSTETPEEICLGPSTNAPGCECIIDGPVEPTVEPITTKVAAEETTTAAAITTPEAMTTEAMTTEAMTTAEILLREFRDEELTNVTETPIVTGEPVTEPVTEPILTTAPIVTGEPNETDAPSATETPIVDTTTAEPGFEGFPYCPDPCPLGEMWNGEKCQSIKPETTTTKTIKTKTTQKDGNARFRYRW